MPGLQTTYMKIKNLRLTHTVLTIKANCAQESQVERAIDLTVKKFGCIDIAVNAAGIADGSAKITKTSTEAMDKMLDVNLKGVWYCEKAEIKQMLKQEMRDLW